MGKIINILKNSDVLSRLSSIGYLPRWLVLMLDVALCLGAYVWRISWRITIIIFSFRRLI